MGLLNHQQLQIIKGTGKFAGDPNPIEDDPVIIDLLGSTGAFSLLDWSPNIPSLKQGGIWADSSINDGRQLIAAVNTNVIETLTIQLSGLSCPVFTANFVALQRLIQDARNFHDTAWQIYPVYLKWWAAGAPGPQYALIFNIDMKVTYQDSTAFQAEIILTIEREFGWRGIEPGANPKKWTQYIASGSVPLSTANAVMISTGINLVSQVFYNHLQRDSLTVFGKQNWIDVPAASIPGDLPALAAVEVSDTDTITFIMLHRNTGIKGTSSGHGQRLDLSASAEDSLGTDTTLANDTGGIVDQGSAARRANISFATVATLANRLTWSVLRIPYMTGRYAVFLRARQNGGTTGDIKVSLKYTGTNSNINVQTTEINITTQAGSGNTTDWPVHYMGVIDIPIDSNSLNYTDGTGLDDDLSFNIVLQARRTTGAGVLYICDVILISIHELSCQVSTPSDMAVDSNIDNTGYFGRGHAVSTIVQPQLFFAGQDLTLIPGVDNRLGLFIYTTGLTSQVGYTGTIKVNIVPRWSGIRNV